MKTRMFLMSLLCLSLGANAQAPDLEYRISDIPPTTPTVAYATGINGTNTGTIQTPESSGEDWWYDIEPFINTNNEKDGYVTSGFATWLDIRLAESGNGNPGLLSAGGTTGDNNGNNYDIHRPIIPNEELSAKLMTLAKYDKHGTMIWCKAYARAEEGAIALTPITDVNGITTGYIFTGWGKATTNTNGGPIFYNPGTSGPAGFDMTDASVPISSRKAKMLVGKIDVDGTLLWLNCYGYQDIVGSVNPVTVLNGHRTLGYDLIETSQNKIRVVGTSGVSSNGSVITEKFFVIDLNQDGTISSKTVFGQNDYTSLAREIEVDATGNNFFITGEQKNLLGSSPGHVNKTDAVLFKIDLAMNQLPFGNDSWNGGTAAIRYALPGGTNNTGFNAVGWDVKVLNNGKVAWGIIENCGGCLSSGSNIGQAKILLINNQNGTGGTNFINLQNINTYGFSQVQAFDMKIGLTATSDGGFACITTVKGEPSDPNLEQASRDNILFQTTGSSTPPGGFNNFANKVWGTDAYVAKFDGNGNMLWDKRWDAFDTPIENYPGDYKEQECMYRIIEDYDGGLVVVGNNSKNKDDYYIAKIRSDCPQTVNYDITNPHLFITNYAPQFGSFNPVTVWDQNFASGFPSGQNVLKVRGVISIGYNETLIIDGITVEFADWRSMEEETKIIIEPGGHLIIRNGAKLTAISDCENTMWEGIEVWGETSSNQSPTSHGYLDINTNATIEHANIAVRLRDSESFSQNGGVIRANNCNFIDNRTDVKFHNFHNYNSLGNEIKNKSYFSEANFKWTDNARFRSPLDHVTLYQVFGVDFIGCNFEDDRSNPISEWIENSNPSTSGIYSIDANYTVKGKCTNSNSTGCTGPIPNPSVIPSTFKNLDFGVYASNSITNYSVKVVNGDFTNNYVGVKVEAVSEPDIYWNNFEFNLTDNLFENELRQRGIEIIASQGINVQENIFTGYGANANETMGILVYNLGESEELIRKNIINSTSFGINVHGKNRSFFGNNSAANGNIGLSLLCNEFDNNLIDNFIFGSGQYGVKSIFGSEQNPAGNEFSQGSQSFPYEDFLHFSTNVLTYNYAGSFNAETPVEFYGITPIARSAHSGCESEIGPCDYCTESTTIYGEFEHLKSELSNYYNTYTNLVNGGSTQGMLNMVDGINGANAHQVRLTLLNASPYITDEVARIVVDKPSSLYPHQWVEELILANIDLAKSNDFMDFLINKTEPLPHSMIENIESALANSNETSFYQLRSQISNLETEKAKISNNFIRYFQSDSTGVPLDSIRYWYTQKGNVLSDFQITDSYIREGKTNDAVSVLNGLTSTISNYTLEQKAEITDFVNFKQTIISVLDNDGELEEMTEGQKGMIRGIAENGSGLAKHQTRALLCYLYGDCEDYDYDHDLPELVESKGISEVLISEDLSEINTELKVYPNPARNRVVIELDGLAFEAVIYIRDLSGRLIKKSVFNQGIYYYNTEDLSNGIYLIEVVDKNTSKILGNQKMVITK